MADLKAVAEQLVNLTVKEVNELATILKEEYGIEPAAAAVAVAAGPVAAAAVEEKTSFDVVLKEANWMVDVAPSPVKHVLPKDEAKSLRQTLEESVAEVELK